MLINIYTRIYICIEKEALDVIDTVELDNLIGELDLFQKEHEAKERERLEKLQQQQQQPQHQNHLPNGHVSEYQIPNPIIPTHHSNNHHHHHHLNDSFISTSTKITGTFSHAFSNGNCSDACSEKAEKISLSASLNYSITSNTSMLTNTQNLNLNCSDSVGKYNSWNDNNDNDLSADTGFENPSFMHLNNDSNIVLIRDDDLPESYYAQNATDVVVLRSKSLGSGSNNNSITDLSTIDATIEMQKQRLSSFKLENNNLTLTPNGSPSHYFSNSNSNNFNNNNSISSINNKSSHGSFGALMYGQIDEPTTLTTNNKSVNVNNNINVVTANKPAITPRPASLLSGIKKL
jgi:hypothetical protein